MHTFLSCVDFLCTFFFGSCSNSEYEIKLCQHKDVVTTKNAEHTFFSLGAVPHVRVETHKILSQLNDKNKQQKQELNIPHFVVGTTFSSA